MNACAFPIMVVTDILSSLYTHSSSLLYLSFTSLSSSLSPTIPSLPPPLSSPLPPSLPPSLPPPSLSHPPPPLSSPLPPSLPLSPPYLYVEVEWGQSVVGSCILMVSPVMLEDLQCRVSMTIPSLQPEQAHLNTSVGPCYTYMYIIHVHEGMYTYITCIPVHTCTCTLYMDMYMQLYSHFCR